MLNGGPGGGGLEYFLGGIFGGPPTAPDYFLELLEDRDVILVDQRAAGRAEPTTFCPNELPVLYEIFGDNQDPVYEKQVLLADMILGRLDDLRASGVDLDQYDTPTIAKDLKALRAALGVSKWNVYEHSYGGQVALEMMRAEYGVADIDARLTAIREKFDANPYVTSDPYTAAPLVLTGKDAAVGLQVRHKQLQQTSSDGLQTRVTPARLDASTVRRPAYRVGR